MAPLIIPEYIVVTVEFFVFLSLLFFAVWGFVRTYRQKIKLGSSQTKAMLFGLGGGLFYYFVPVISLAIVFVPLRAFVVDYAIVVSPKFSTIPEKSFVLVDKIISSETISRTNYILSRDGEIMRVFFVIGKQEDLYLLEHGNLQLCHKNVDACLSVKNDEILVSDSYPVTASSTIKIIKTEDIFGKIISRQEE